MDKIMEKRTPTEAIYGKIGKNIAEIRRSLNMTQQDLADKIETTRQTITLYETGQRRIPLVALLDIKETLHVELDQLLPNQQNKKPGPEPRVKVGFQKIMDLSVSDQKLVLDLLDTLHQKK